MQYEIQNLSRRLVSVHCNSGKTCHLAPGTNHEVPEQEITGNRSVKKLVERNLISTRKISSSSVKTAASTGATTSRATSTKKASKKKSSSRAHSRS